MEVKEERDGDMDFLPQNKASNQVSFYFIF